MHDTSELVGLFKMPIVFEIHFTDGTSIKKTQWIKKQKEEVKMKTPKGKKVAYVLFDADNKILKNVTFNHLKIQIQPAIKNANLIIKYLLNLTIKKM